MPYITTTTNVSVSSEKYESIKSKFGKAIELIPGKSENWLMLSFNPDSKMYFKGCETNAMAFVNVSIFGGASNEDYDNLTAELTKILSAELGIAPSDIYIKYEECYHWGWNGSNF